MISEFVVAWVSGVVGSDCDGLSKASSAASHTSDPGWQAAANAGQNTYTLFDYIVLSVSFKYIAGSRRAD